MGKNPEGQFLEAYERYNDAIFRHCYFRLYQNRERTLDIMQETFTKTWAYIARGNEIENLRAFLYRTASNLIIDESRKKRPLSLDALREEGFDPPEDAHHTERGAERAELHATLAKLDEDYRDVLIMRYVDDLSVKEIAAALGTSENVVSVRIHRGIKKIRELLS